MPPTGSRIIFLSRVVEKGSRKPKSGFIFCILYLLLFSSAVQANTLFQSNELELSFDDHSGVINRVDLATQKNRGQGFSLLSKAGNILSFPWRTQPILTSQSIVKTEPGTKKVRSVFDERGLRVTREIKSGDSAYGLSIQYRITNSTNKTIDLSARLLPQLQCCEGFDAFIDEDGGFGSSIYSYRNAFFAHTEGAEIIEPGVNGESFTPHSDGWIGWVNRYNAIAIKWNNAEGNSDIYIKYPLAGDGNETQPKPQPVVVLPPALWQCAKP